MKQSAYIVCVFAALAANAHASTTDSSFGVQREGFTKEWHEALRLKNQDTARELSRVILADALAPEALLEQMRVALSDSSATLIESQMAFQENEQPNRAP